MSLINSKINGKEVDLFFEAILNLKTKEECYKFFDDVATITEIKSLSQRIQVAELLREGKTYTEIGEKTGASTATISRVNRCLNYGSEGYNLVLDRMDSMKKL